MSTVQALCFLVLFYAYESLDRRDLAFGEENNEYEKETGSNGEDIWRSTSDFIPVQSQSFGTITLGQIMQMEFDFIWWGRTNSPRNPAYECFFRIGFNASHGTDCNGEGARYPSFWIAQKTDTMHVSVSSGTFCQTGQSLSDYGPITIGTSYHLNIAFNDTIVKVDVSEGNGDNWSQLFSREPTQSQYIGDLLPVWWMSNKYEEEYNRGNGTFSNITITSRLFTEGPTTQPTQEPTTLKPTSTPTHHPSVNPTSYPTSKPTISPTDIPTLNPTTAQPTAVTDNPTTSFPTTITNNPTTATPTAQTESPTSHPISNPTISPFEREAPVVELSTNIPIYSTQKQGEMDIGTSRNTVMTIGIIVAIVTVFCCIIVGIVLLCRKRSDEDTKPKKSSNLQWEGGINKHQYVPTLTGTETQMVMNEICNDLDDNGAALYDINDQYMSPDGQVIHPPVALSPRFHKFFSAAQKEEYCKTSGVVSPAEHKADDVYKEYLSAGDVCELDILQKSSESGDSNGALMQMDEEEANEFTTTDDDVLSGMSDFQTAGFIDSTSAFFNRNHEEEQETIVRSDIREAAQSRVRESVLSEMNITIGDLDELEEKQNVDQYQDVDDNPSTTFNEDNPSTTLSNVESKLNDNMSSTSCDLDGNVAMTEMNETVSLQDFDVSLVSTTLSE